jgi:hypothetical protein
MEEKAEFDFNRFAAEVAIWSEKNFGPKTNIAKGYKYPHQPLLGIIEEFGELCIAVDNLNTYGIQAKKDNFIDAVGDTVIYITDYCNQLNLNLDTIILNAHNYKCEEDLNTLIILGCLCHNHLKMEQCIRGTTEEHLFAITEDLVNLFYLLKYICNEQFISFDECVKVTWEKVQKRDWTKNKLMEKYYERR